MHGLVPGPEMLTKHLDVTYSIIWTLTLSHIMGAGICIAASGLFARLATVRVGVLLPLVLTVIFIGAYQGSQSWGDLYSLVLFGALGWVMKHLGWPRPPLILGFVLGGIFERYFFISTEIYGAAWVLRPVVLAVFAAALWVVLPPLKTHLAGYGRDVPRSSASPRCASAATPRSALVARSRRCSSGCGSRALAAGGAIRAATPPLLRAVLRRAQSR